MMVTTRPDRRLWRVGGGCGCSPGADRGGDRSRMCTGFAPPTTVRVVERSSGPLPATAPWTTSWPWSPATLSAADARTRGAPP